MPRKIVVTSALPYANGSIHIGHLVEYLQTDIWVRFQKMCGNYCLYFCADDAHGTPIMITARTIGVTPEELIQRMGREHKADFDSFLIEFDNYYSTHSPENRAFSEQIFGRLKDAGSIVKRSVEQTYCEKCRMFLPDRYVRGTCPRCKAVDQYGDSCDKCGGTYQPTELIEPRCSTCSAMPVRKSSEHYFFKLSDFENRLKELFAAGFIQQTVANKLDEWFKAGLKDWDISRDGPYFGFVIPGEKDKFFYVWLDAPIGYMASAKNWCDKNGLDFDKVWNGTEYELYHFIGKDIMYFHALFWPAMLMGSGFKTANRLFVHGFLTVNGEKMSKSKGTFIKASTYLKHLDPEYLRYYYASKLAGGVEDIDLSIEDFVNRINSDMVGKLANIASRSGPMLTKQLGAMLGSIQNDSHKQMIDKLTAARDGIVNDYENLNYASVIRTVGAMADDVNRFVEQVRPWEVIKTNPEQTRKDLTAVLNAVRILTIYLKPVLPRFAAKIEKFLNTGSLNFTDVGSVLENRKINDFERLVERIDKDKVNAMLEDSRETEGIKPAAVQTEPIAAECTIEDFAKIDLRIARVVKAEAVEGADKLLRLELDLGGLNKTVLAGIAQAYRPQDLAGKLVICLANLKPRKMKFGTSEGMVLAAGSGGKDLFLLTADAGATPGRRVS